MCDQTHQPAIFARDHQTADLVQMHRTRRIGNRFIRTDRVGIIHDKPLGALHLLDLTHLLLDGHKAMDNPQPASARHRDRHRRLGDGVHVGAQNRHAHLDRRRDKRGSVHILAGSDRGALRDQ